MWPRSLPKRVRKSLMPWEKCEMKQPAHSIQQGRHMHYMYAKIKKKNIRRFTVVVLIRWLSDEAPPALVMGIMSIKFKSSVPRRIEYLLRAFAISVWFRLLISFLTYSFSLYSSTKRLVFQNYPEVTFKHCRTCRPIALLSTSDTHKLTFLDLLILGSHAHPTSFYFSWTCRFETCLSCS